MNISVGPPPVPGQVPEHVRAAVLDLLPLHLQAEAAQLLLQHRRARLLGARERRRRDEPDRQLDQAALVDRDRHARSPCATFTETGTRELAIRVILLEVALEGVADTALILGRLAEDQSARPHRAAE